jgi:hypothetical protein
VPGKARKGELHYENNGKDEMNILEEMNKKLLRWKYDRDGLE